MPKMKPIVFTEFGFPAVDACTNKPYKLFNKHFTDDGFPIHLTGVVNKDYQEMAIQATDYIRELNDNPETKDIVEGMFNYNVDARGELTRTELAYLWLMQTKTLATHLLHRHKA